MGFARQGIANMPFLARVDRLQQGNFALRADGDRHPIAIQQAVPRLRTDAPARRDNAGEIQRISGAECDQIALPRPVADFPQGGHRRGQRILLAGNALHKTPAAQLATRLQASVDIKQFPPGGQPAFPFQHPAENNAVAAQQHPRDVFGMIQGIAIAGCRGTQQRPASGGGKSFRAGMTATLQPLRQDELTQATKAVAGNQPPGGEFPQRRLQLRSEQAGLRQQFVEKTRPPLAQSVMHPARRPRERQTRGRQQRREGAPVGEVCAGYKGDRRGAHRRRAALRLLSRWRHLQAQPQYLAGAAQTVEFGARIRLHARR